MGKIYRKEQRLSEIINDNPLILMVMSRFCISLGFGEKSVEAICREQNVDCNTFLSIANFISFKTCNTENIALQSLMTYLENAHEYFIDFCLPMIRRKLIDAIGGSGNNELSLLILKFYDDYVDEVRRHMDYESGEVFGYVRRLINGQVDEKFSIDVFADHHHSIHDKLKAMKDILIRYLPQKDSNMLNVVLFDIISCEEDLLTHCQVEDKIFVPVVRRLEADLSVANQAVEAATEDAPRQKDDSISDRERDIIECVARGLSNKEIADKLCISINTVTTHRRNIAQKLQIHSSAGLTIYAIIAGIVNIDDLAPHK